MDISKDHPDLVRSRTIYKDEFILEESRPKDPLIRTPSTGSDTVSSCGSSHLSSSPRDSPRSIKGKPARNDRSNLVKSQQVTGNSANIVGSMKVGPAKLSEKSSPPNVNGTKDNTLVETSNSSGLNFKIKDIKDNAVTTVNSKYASVLHTMAVRNAAAQNGSKGTATNKNGSKSGGTITVHGIMGEDNSTNFDPNTATSKDSRGNLAENSKKEETSIKGHGSSKPETRTSEPKATPPSTNAKKKAAQKMQNVLQVVPTKLTENILKTAPKSGVRDEKSVTKLVPSKTGEKMPKCQTQDTVSNINMHLSPSAQVETRLSTHESSTRKDTNNSVGEKRSFEMNNTEGSEKIENQLNDNKETVKSDKVQGKPADNLPLSENKTNANAKNVSGIQKTGKQLNSAVTVNREGAQSRNASFNVAKSAGTNQRQMGNVRKTSSSFTPRVQSNNTSKPVSTASNKLSNKVASANNTGSTMIASKVNSNISNETGKTETQSGPVTQKPSNSSSPTELVTSSVSKSASIAKSYNMGGIQSLSKSSSSGSITSDTSATKSVVSEKAEVAVKKHSVVSKSVSEPMQSATKVSNVSIVSKSVSQMPSVGTIVSDKPQNKALLRSSSMTVIEEAKEKKLMSSSDTKIQCTSESNKGRPSSDGPIIVSGSKENSNNTKSPLIDIMPDCAPRINRKNYMDINNPVTTPVIVNPFEELEQKRALTATEFGFVIDKPSVERSKTQVSLKGRNAKSPKKAVNSSKPSSASTRGSSGRKRRSRSKEANKSDTENSRPKTGKSGRRVRSGKRKRKIPENLAKENEKSDVALIGGIGWQIATSCIDKSEADAVVVSQIDSSESDEEDTVMLRLNSPLHIAIPDDALQVPSALDTPSSVYSPRFREVRPTFDKEEEDLPYCENDGYRPMNLDMTQNSLTQQNRAGVIIKHDMPGDISDFLSQLREDDSEVFEDEYDDYENEENLFHKEVVIGQLTPIPESPSLTNTQSTLKHVAKTVDAINKFDQVVRDDDLNKLLGSTPRNKLSSSLDNSSYNLSKNGSLRNSGGPVRSSPSQKDLKQSVTSSASSRNIPSRNSSSKTNLSRTSNLSNEIREKANKVFGNAEVSPKCNTPIESSFGKSSVGKTKAGNLRKSASKETLNEREQCQSDINENEIRIVDGPVKADANSETKERIDSKILDLKKLLAEKMQTTQKLLEESSPYNSYKRRKQNESAQDYVINESPSLTNDVKLNFKDVTEDNTSALDTCRTDDDMKSTRSSRKERKFSETKKGEDKDEDIKEAIEEILSNTFPSSKSNVKAMNSFRSASSTLTEADRNVLKKMVEENKASPFHAKETVRGSSSFDESVTLSKDNPELMKRFTAENFKMGQKVKAMIDAGAEKTKVKAMVKADNEAKQLARIMNSFRQMELYAGPHSTNNRSSKKETPRRDGEHMHKSLSRFDNPHHSHHMGIPPRPGSAGAGRMRPGKFTEIKGGKSASHVGGRANSPINVPKVSLTQAY